VHSVFKVKSINLLRLLFTRGKHTLPELPYDYGALEPVISADIMKLHHQKHHQAYVTNLNIAEQKMQEALAKGVTCLFGQLSFKSNMLKITHSHRG